MGLFSRRDDAPPAPCPRCGGSKPASLPICTTCKTKENAQSNPLGFPGSEQEKRARAGGAHWAPPEAGPSMPPPYGAPQAPPRPGSHPLSAPAAGGGRGVDLSTDPYAPGLANYPERTKAGLYVRHHAELVVADHFFDAKVAVAFEPVVAGYRPTFLVPVLETVVEVGSPVSPLPAWQRSEREAAYQGYGFRPVRVDAKAGDIGAEIKRLVPLD